MKLSEKIFCVTLCFHINGNEHQLTITASTAGPRARSTYILTQGFEELLTAKSRLKTDIIQV